jgi:predicted ATPase
VFRLEGELMLIDPEGSAAAAEERLRTALDLARARAEKSLELRAAMSLARLWREQGKRKQGSDLIGAVYGFFTEGFQTRDLLAAKALMKELAAAGSE